MFEYFHISDASLLPLSVGEAIEFGSLRIDWFLILLSRLNLNFLQLNYWLKVDILALNNLLM